MRPRRSRRGRRSDRRCSRTWERAARADQSGLDVAVEGAARGAAAADVDPDVVRRAPSCGSPRSSRRSSPSAEVGARREQAVAGAREVSHGLRLGVRRCRERDRHRRELDGGEVRAAGVASAEGVEVINVGRGSASTRSRTATLTRPRARCRARSSAVLQRAPSTACQTPSEPARQRRLRGRGRTVPSSVSWHCAGVGDAVAQRRSPACRTSARRAARGRPRRRRPRASDRCGSRARPRSASTSGVSTMPSVRSGSCTGSSSPGERLAAGVARVVAREHRGDAVVVQAARQARARLGVAELRVELADLAAWRSGRGPARAASVLCALRAVVAADEVHEAPDARDARLRARRARRARRRSRTLRQVVALRRPRRPCAPNRSTLARLDLRGIGATRERIVRGAGVAADRVQEATRSVGRPARRERGARRPDRSPGPCRAVHADKLSDEFVTENAE